MVFDANLQIADVLDKCNDPRPKRAAPTSICSLKSEENSSNFIFCFSFWENLEQCNRNIKATATMTLLLLDEFVAIAVVGEDNAPGRCSTLSLSHSSTCLGQLPPTGRQQPLGCVKKCLNIDLEEKQITRNLTVGSEDSGETPPHPSRWVGKGPTILASDQREAKGRQHKTQR